MGDSFAEGVGLEFGETFAGILAEQLSHDGIEVLNAAVMSYAPTIYYRKTRHLLEDVGLEFDRMVVFLDISDIQDEAYFYDLDEEGRVTMNHEDAPHWALATIQSKRQLGLRQRVTRFLKSNSVTVHALASAAQIFRRGRPARPTPDAPMLDEARALWTVDDALFEEYGRRGLARARSRMDQLAEVLRKRSIDLTVVVYPWPDQVARGDRESKHVAFWRKWSAEAGATFVDLFPPFFEESASEVLGKYFVPGDVHYNEAGNRLIAREFLERWKANGVGP